MFEKSNTKVIEISLTLVIEKYKIFTVFKDTVENLSTFTGKVRIRFAVHVSVIT